MSGKFIFLHVVSLMCHSWNLSWKIAVQSADCVLTYFCGAQTSWKMTKYPPFYLKFVSSKKKLFNISLEELSEWKRKKDKEIIMCKVVCETQTDPCPYHVPINWQLHSLVVLINLVLV